jgi:hypothetical protein
MCNSKDTADNRTPAENKPSTSPGEIPAVHEVRITAHGIYHDPIPVTEIPLKPIDIRIWTALKDAYPQTVAQLDLSVATGLAERTIRDRLQLLRGYHLVYCPHGGKGRRRVERLGRSMPMR